MPSARPSNFRGGGGILRKKDGTILAVNFTTENPLFKNDKPTQRKPGQKVSDFVWLYGVLTIQEDGRDQLTYQPLKVGNVEDFEVVLDGQGLSGTVEIGKNSEFGVFMNSLAHPTQGDGQDGFDESLFPEDPDGLVADYRALAGARVQFDWIPDESKWAKANPRKVKREGQKEREYAREHLIVAQFYGMVDVHASVATKPGTKKPAGAAGRSEATKSGKANGAAKTSTDLYVAQLAGDNVVLALSAAKDNKLSKTKLSVKLLQLLQDPKYNDIRDDVRAYAFDDKNIAAMEGVKYDTATQTVSLEA